MLNGTGMQTRPRTLRAAGAGALAIACVVSGTAFAGRPAATTCLRLADPSGDQLLMYSDVTAAPGPTSLDIRGVTASLKPREFRLNWRLGQLQRPAPGQSWTYKFRFTHGEASYDVTAIMRAGPAPALPDQFQIINSKDLTPAVQVPGQFDLATNTLAMTVPSSALGLTSFKSFSMSPTDLYTSQDFAETAGLYSDEIVKGFATLVAARGC